MASRKTVSVDVLRQMLGDSRTDDLLEKLAPSKPTIQLDVQSLTLAKTLYSDPLIDSKQWADTVPVLRRYFLERGQARRGLLSWLDEATAGAGDSAPSAEETPRPQPTRSNAEAPAPRRAGPPRGREARSRRPAAQRGRS